MRVAVVGGHLTPALAVLEKLNKQNVFYIGRKHTFEGEKTLSLEYAEIQKLDIPFYSITTGRLQRRFTKQTIPSLLKVPNGFFQSLRILKKEKPTVVLAFGGYISVPVCLAASLLKIPVVIHEQTLEAGFANKILTKTAKKICISWESSFNFFPREKTILTGNPVRKEVFFSKADKEKENHIFVTGGSSGSHSINVLIEKTIDNLLEKFSVLHQTGDFKKFGDYERLLEKKKVVSPKSEKSYEVVKFLAPEEAAKEIADATIVVGRSGINTITELIFHEKPALLIPLPFGQKDEQLKNAMFFKSLGLGEFIEQKDLTPQLFLEKLNDMVLNIDKYKLNQKFNFEEASDKIVEVLNGI